LKREFHIEDKWLPFEIHPDTPPEGVRWADYFPGMDPEGFFDQLDRRGKPMGIRFGPQPLMSNSRKAMEGGEFAKVHGRYETYHAAIFRAFFTGCRDIGNRDVLLDIAQTAGLDRQAFAAALDSRTYLSRLAETTRRARERGITSAPTFLIDGYGTITGAQPLGTFRAALLELEQGKSEGRIHAV